MNDNYNCFVKLPAVGSVEDIARLTDEVDPETKKRDSYKKKDK